VPPVSRPLTVAVTGSECTGKTTLAARLAERFDAPWSREYAREYVDLAARVLDETDVEPIARGQRDGEQAAEDEARRRNAPVIVRDTDLVSTAVYSRHYYGTCPEWVSAAARERVADLYLLLWPDVPWVADGLNRDRPDDAARQEIHRIFRETLAAAGARVIDIRGDWQTREAAAIRAVTAALAAVP
jgi:NadR type nicotinamide-nucleotide adenylyltransferase